MFVSILTATTQGMDSSIIQVEVDTSNGLPCFQMIGLLSSEVREAKDRVRVAMKNAGLTLPAASINVNLSPADIRKDGTGYDLPIAVGIMAALSEISIDRVANTIFIGELGLNGEIKGVRGILPIVREAANHKIKRIILPESNKEEAALIPGIEIIAAPTLKLLYQYLKSDDVEKNNILPPVNHQPIDDFLKISLDNMPDFSDVHGQAGTKRAAMLAAAGFHHLLMIGPPGAGKTMIAKRIPSILPPLTSDESLEVTSIYSVAGKLNDSTPFISSRPFIAPHHTITEQALVGGGVIPRPGAISLAHRGVLFLDETTEFSRSTLDIMRQPLEDKYIYISRSHGTYKYPADFMLVASCNPCPCGYYPNLNKCRCSDSQVKRYLNRLSGPLLDRIDICCDVEPVDLCKPVDSYPTISSHDMRQKIMCARERQTHRFKDTASIHFNSEMSVKDIEEYCRLGQSEAQMLHDAYIRLAMSARSYHRILRLSRTIADIEDSSDIKEDYLAEAILYHTSGSRYWGN